MSIKSFTSSTPRTALLAGVALVLAMSSFATQAQAETAPPQGAFVGVITIKSLPVKIKLQLKGEADSTVDYGAPQSCGLALEFITQTSDGFAYAFKPKQGGASGFAPYCNRLLGGRAWLKPGGNGFSYLPLDDRGTPLEYGNVDPAPPTR